MSYLGFYSVQRRELRKYNALVSRSSFLVGFIFFVGCIGFGNRLGQARTRSTVLCCVEAAKKEEVQFGSNFILIDLCSEYQLIL